jgi:hypothetical protein
MFERRASALFVVLAAIYSSIHALGYVWSPLGMAPQLDAREQIALAQQIAGGTLTEPFYRAPGYPLLLALWLKAGVEVSALPLLAAFMNVLLHALGVWCVGRIGALLQVPPRWALAAMALWALYPVAAYFVAEPIDVTLAITLLLLGIWATLASERAFVNHAPPQLAAALAGLSFALAIATRPQLLIPALLALLWLGFRLRHRIDARSALIAGFAAPLLALGFWNQSIGAEFRVLPWQGGYSLYRAHGAAADPRWFEQMETLPDLEPGQNPARLESAKRYRRVHDRAAPSIDALNQYWKEQLFAEVGRDPLRWLRLIAKRARYTFNQFEQYNNKTYAYQVRLSPSLRFNPIGFALALTLGVVGFACAWRDRRYVLLALVAAGVVLSVLLTWPSDRFRLPLVPVLLLLATGLSRWASVGKARFALALPTLALALWPIPKAEREMTYSNDALLWGNAWMERGDRARAHAFFAEAAALGDPRGHERLCTIDIEAWLHQPGSLLNQATIRSCAQAAAAPGAFSAQFLLALVLAQTGSDDPARQLLDAVIRNADPLLRGRAIGARGLLDGGALDGLRASYPELDLSDDPTLRALFDDAPNASALSLWSVFDRRTAPSAR